VSAVIDSLPEISAVEPSSAASRAGLLPGDRIVSVNGVSPRDILEWHRLVESDVVDLQVARGRESLDLVVERLPGEPFGASVSSAVFDRIHTCDNHCEFCFIYQLPKGMRQSLYLKDDDYRLSFLFGNFTTLTRFTEADLERVLDERLSPLYVSIHAVDPNVRSEMLRNNRGGFSLRWLRLMLDNGINARAQIVLCPGVNDGDILDSTLCGLLEQFPELESIAIVPLGLSRYNPESRMRVHTPEEAAQTISRQLRLRNLGGIIIIDFIDMQSEDHKKQVLTALQRNLDKDHAKTKITEVSALGLVEMTRKRTRESLEHILCEPCSTCGGRGVLKTSESICLEIFREIIRVVRQYNVQQIMVLASEQVVEMLLDEEADMLAELESFLNIGIKIRAEAEYNQEHYDVVLL